MKAIDYQRHFAILSAASVVVVFSIYLPMPHLNWIPKPIFIFGLIGALHAFALVASLKRNESLFTSASVIFITAVLSILSPIIGIAVSTLFSALPELGYIAIFAIASGFGAFSYWLLIRMSLIRALPIKYLMFPVIFCSLTTLLALACSVLLTDFGAIHDGFRKDFSDILPSITWWYAFSYSLYLGETAFQNANINSKSDNEVSTPTFS